MSHVNTLNLHRYRLGEMDASEAQIVRDHLDSCERCATRLNAQQNERAAFVAQPTPDVIKRAARPPAANRSMAPWVLGVVAVAAAALFGVYVANFDPPGAALDPDQAHTRMKGDLPDLELWLQTDVGPRAMRAGESLSSGDTVQLLFRPKGAAWVTLAGKDGGGTLEVWGTAEALGDHLQPAPFGLTLDDAPGPQVFYAIASDTPLDLAGVEAAISGDADNARVRTLTVPKE